MPPKKFLSLIQSGGISGCLIGTHMHYVKLEELDDTNKFCLTVRCPFPAELNLLRIFSLETSILVKSKTT